MSAIVVAHDARVEVCPLADLEREGSRVLSVDGRTVLVLVDQGKVYALDNRCPHVDGQRKCPAKWPAKMSLVLLAMITDGSYSTRSSFMGGLRASMYFFAVSRWMPSSRATPRVDNPLRFAF